MVQGFFMAKNTKKKPTYEELTQALQQALDHLDYCGWGDSWERECSENLRRELPALLERAK